MWNNSKKYRPIFDLAQTLYRSQEVKAFLTRINVFILTDGDFKSEIPATDKFKEWSVYHQVIDINYLYNLSDKSHIPIAIEFSQPLPCIIADDRNDEYQSYLSITPNCSMKQTNCLSKMHKPIHKPQKLPSTSSNEWRSLTEKREY